MMVPHTKDPKTSSGSSLRLPNSAPKVKSVRKPVKAQDNNVPSRSKESSSYKTHDQLDRQDVTWDQDFGKNDAIFLKYRNFNRYGTAKDYSDHRSREVKPPQASI